MYRHPSSAQVIDGCLTCYKCGVKMHQSYFIARANRPNGAGYYYDCRACRREDWRKASRARRGLKGFCKAVTLHGDYAPIAAAIVAEASRMTPGQLGVNVFKMLDGSIRFWRGAMKPPKTAERIGLYDFDATESDILEDLQA